MSRAQCANTSGYHNAGRIYTELYTSDNYVIQERIVSERGGGRSFLTWSDASQGITWVYMGFVNGGFKILWCESLWVATSPCGGFGAILDLLDPYFNTFWG